MVHILHIRNGDFEARVLMSSLPDLTLAKFRKLLRLGLTSSENDESIRELLAWIGPAIEDADAECMVAHRRFVDGWKTPPKGKAGEATKANNAKLKAAVRKAKTELDRLVKLRDIINQETENYF